MGNAATDPINTNTKTPVDDSFESWKLAGSSNDPEVLLNLSKNSSTSVSSVLSQNPSSNSETLSNIYASIVASHEEGKMKDFQFSIVMDNLLEHDYLPYDIYAKILNEKDSSFPHPDIEGESTPTLTQGHQILNIKSEERLLELALDDNLSIEVATAISDNPHSNTATLDAIYKKVSSEIELRNITDQEFTPIQYNLSSHSNSSDLVIDGVNGWGEQTINFPSSSGVGPITCDPETPAQKEGISVDEISAEKLIGISNETNKEKDGKLSPFDIVDDSVEIGAGISSGRSM